MKKAPRRISVALIALACLPFTALAQNADADDEPPVERGKLETFGPRGKVFATEGSRELVLMTRQSYAAEHGAGYFGEFRLISRGVPPGQRTFRYETVCASERKGYRLARATESGKKEQDPAYSASIVEVNRAPKPTEKAAYNLYWAACKKQFQRFM